MKARTPTGRVVTVRPHGTAEVHGIDYGPTRLHSENGTTLVLRVDGHMAWSGRGQRRYASPSLLVFKIDDIRLHAGGTVYTVTGMIEIPQGRKS